ncbi:hypothetical protein Bca52824_055298 [Brassica carinata]|uniref:Uncharacterized protein n=1 Tax=Brassica carinata TaxID=52824 RepID=A0A8X7R7D7_BRACI|nr:hypothetical protein Bca52824_055298 [Brassica carinata]
MKNPLRELDLLLRWKVSFQTSYDDSKKLHKFRSEALGRPEASSTLKPPSPELHNEAQHFERIEVTKDQALEMFSDNNFKASSAYWKGSKDPKNPVSLQRVYGISYPDQKQLKKYLQFLEEAKKYDHRILGQKQEPFFCHPLSG